MCKNDVMIMGIPKNINLQFIFKEFGARRAIACETLEQAKKVKDDCIKGSKRIDFYTGMFLEFIEKMGLMLTKSENGFGLKEYKLPKCDYHHVDYDTTEMFSITFTSISELLDYIFKKIVFDTNMYIASSYDCNLMLKELRNNADKISFNDCYHAVNYK